MPPKKRKQVKSDDYSTDEEEANLNSKKSKSVESTSLKYDLEWSEYGEKSSKNLRPLFYLSSNSLPSCTKVAAFDIDGTIIVTKSGKNFAINSQDWKWFDKSVPKKLRELNDDSFRIVFITNQAGIEKGKTKFVDLKTKFDAIVKELDIPVFILIATGETHFRKPSIEMWSFFVDNLNKSEKVDMKESFFVGDAAGRMKNWAPGKPKDFSCADRMFASNLNLKFYTPEEYFFGHKAVKFEWGSIDPNDVIKKSENQNNKQLETEYHKSEQDLIILLGPPASGKSTFYKKYLQKYDYVHINRDTLQTQEKCLKAAENALKEGKSVCVDNTNPSKKIRSDYLALAKKLNVKSIRCFKMSTPIELCHHLNYVRQNMTQGKTRRIPDVGYNMFKSQFEEPDTTEGFNQVLNIQFRPEFDDQTHEKIFKQWTN